MSAEDITTGGGETDSGKRVQEEPEAKQCVICLSEFSAERALLESCQHEFCLVCLKSWSSKSVSCPLCKGEFKSYIIKRDGVSEDETVHCEEPKKEEEYAEPELDCLDHAYFIEEIGRLMHRIGAVKNVLLARSRGKGQGSFVVLCDVENRLSMYYEDLLLLNTFDPVALLPELYSLQNLVGSIERGEYQPGDYETSVGPQYDDEWDEEDYDDDYYGYDDDGDDLCAEFKGSMKLSGARVSGGRGGGQGSRGGGSNKTPKRKSSASGSQACTVTASSS